MSTHQRTTTHQHHRVSEAAEAVENGVETAASNLHHSLQGLKDRAMHIRDNAQAKIKSTEGSIKQHPWAAVGIAAAAGAGVGLLIGLFARRVRD